MGRWKFSQLSPPHRNRTKNALIFQNGGFGCASVWLQFMKFFSEMGYPCYAHSVRGHGASWKPGYFRMVWMTGKASFAEDLGYAFSCVEGFEAVKRDGSLNAGDIGFDGPFYW
jgi:pimeloyl-ACP methyl ester carboxylesterase